jgi:alpha-glucosidase (family GH31 glycosyl hydrolase)
MDILKSKLRSIMMPDAMVIRTIFDVIDSPPKFNADYKDRELPSDIISLELMLIASSSLSNQTFMFDTQDHPSANEMLQTWQDKCVAACECC